MKFWRDQRGVSVVIGTVLMAMLGVGMYTIIQTMQVPLWNKMVEAEHASTVYDDMVALKAGLSDVAVWRLPKSGIIHMGKQYPNRMIFSNPGIGITGSISSETMTITVDYTLDMPGDPSFSTTFQSSRLIYEAQASTITKLVNEYGVVIREHPNAAVTTDTQTLVRTDEIYVPLIDSTNLALNTSLGSASIMIKPFLTPNSITKIKTVTVTLPTDYPTVWSDLLSEVTLGADVTVTVNQVAKTITIVSTGVKLIEYTQGGVTENALYSGLLTFTKRAPPELPPGYTNIDSSTDYPRITTITMSPQGTGQTGRTHSTITAVVKNVTAPSDIHLDYNDLSDNPLDYDAAPTDVVSPPGYSMSDTSWAQPTPDITVRWYNIEHEEYNNGQAVALSFWVYNRTLNQRFATVRVFSRSTQGQGSWE